MEKIGNTYVNDDGVVVAHEIGQDFCDRIKAICDKFCPEDIEEEEPEFEFTPIY